MRVYGIRMAPGKMKTEVLVGIRDRDGEIRLASTGRSAPKRWRSPSPEAIRKARKAAWLTQSAACTPRSGMCSSTP
jgi:hypothetical protein